MSRLRANLITNQTADGAPTVQDGIVVTGICTATNFKKSDGSDVGAATVVTIGVRTGTAITFSATGSSFNVVGRSGNIPISI
jgi:hypothetical protein